MIYLIGDIQGCCGALERLLQTLDFSPSRDHLFALGDLVNRGPDSLGTLRRLQALGGSATCLLGNHDWHLLAAAAGVRPPHRQDTLQAILAAPDREAHLHWLRQQRMAVQAHGWLMVHAGLAPQWDVATTLALAGALEERLRSPDLPDFLRVMYGNEPSLWDDGLGGVERLRFALNTLTRIRFVRPDGGLELNGKEQRQGPTGCVPWFEAPNRRTRGVPVAFGHWSTLGLTSRPDLLCLDTGCVWGGHLTAARLGADDPVDPAQRTFTQVACTQAQKPG
jgi:bis(5'-nucleosyl)-tetraphosphatase (symmetrical)